MGSQHVEWKSRRIITLRPPQATQQDVTPQKSYNKQTTPKIPKVLFRPGELDESMNDTCVSMRAWFVILESMWKSDVLAHTHLCAEETGEKIHGSQKPASPTDLVKTRYTGAQNIRQSGWKDCSVGETAQQVSTAYARPEDQGSIPSTNTVAQNQMQFQFQGF